MKRENPSPRLMGPQRRSWGLSRCCMGIGGPGLDGQERLDIQGLCQGCLGEGDRGLRKIPGAPR